MAIPLIEPRAFFGLKTGIKGNVGYISNQKILYPVGGILALHDYTQNSQEYIHLTEKNKEINILCISPNKQMIAAAEKGDQASISLYDIIERKRIKGLVIPFDTITSKEFVSMGFTCDGKYLIAIVGEPDWMLLCYNWEEGKVESSSIANNPNNPGSISQVCCNPSDNAVVCIIGPGLFRMLNVSESTWRQFGWQKADNFPITCGCWLSFDRAMAGTQDGRLLLVESGELKAIYRAAEVTYMEMKFKDDTPPITADINLMQLDKKALALGLEVRELISFNKGFAFACGSGTVHVFEKEPKSHHKFHKSHVFKITSHEFRDNPTSDLNIIQCISVNLSEDKLLAITKRSQLYEANFTGPDIKQMPNIAFKMVGEQLHQGPVVGLAMCVWKPIFITVGGIDRTVRVWNYQTRKQDMIKQYEEDVFSVALHPSGLYVLLGFSAKLRLMILLIDDIQPCREFNIRNCPQSSFSSNGHLFAAVSRNDIEIYSTVSFQLMYNFKGHSGEIKSLKWTPTDDKLVSCGLEGGVYEWEMAEGNRVGATVTKSCPYLDLAVMSDGKFCYVVGKDGQIKEITNSMIRRGIQLLNSQLDAIIISRSDQMLFVAGANGSLLSVNFPIIERIQLKEYRMHDRPITKMLMTYDDKTIVTVSDDGTVCLWDLTFTDEKEVTMDPEFQHFGNILISTEELRKKNLSIKELSERLVELDTEHSYVMRKTEAGHAQKMGKMQESYQRALEELDNKNKQMAGEHLMEVNQLKSKITQTIDEHEQAAENLEGKCNATLIGEYDKYTFLEEQIKKTKEDYEIKLDELTKSKNTAMEQMQGNYEAQVKNLKTELQKLKEATQNQCKVHESIKQQIEDDADGEIMELRAKHERLFVEEKEKIVKYRSDVGVMKKKLISSQKNTELYKQQVATAQGDVLKSQQTIATLQKDITDLKKEVKERDMTIEDKEKTILELKMKKQQLDRYKFVLNYKIDDLSNQMKPKDQDIKDKKDQIREMETELVGMQKSLASLKQTMSFEQEKVAATKSLLTIEQDQRRHLFVELSNIRVELYKASCCIQEPSKLKQIVLELFRKYTEGTEFASGLVNHKDAEVELKRQRGHLEGAVEALTRRVDKKAAREKSEWTRLLNENVTLLGEVNSLRLALKVAKDKLKDTITSRKVNGKLPQTHQSKQRLVMTAKGHRTQHARHQEKSDADKKIELLNQEIERLIKRLSKEAQIKHVHEEKEKLRVRLQEDP